MAGEMWSAYDAMVTIAPATDLTAIGRPGDKSYKSTITALRTALMLGGTGYTAGDRLVIAAITLGGTTVVTSTPVIAATQTWNDGAVTFKGMSLTITDTASAAASLFLDFLVGASSKFSVSKAGAVIAAATVAFTGGTFTTTLISTTAQATLGALAATQASVYASTVSGTTLQGFGTTGDVTLKNRAGTDVIVVTSNTTGVTMAGALAMTGALSGVTTLAASGILTLTNATDSTSAADGAVIVAGGVGIAKKLFVTGVVAFASTVSFTGGTFTTTVKSVTAQATLGALSATQGSFYASTVSGATLQGFGTTGDVTLKNRAGTDVIVVTSNTTGVTFAGAGAFVGAVTGLSFLSASPTGGIGYATGAGGAVTQATNKQTTVVSNTLTTAITMHNQVLNAGVITGFTFTNSTIAATDTVIVTHESAGTSGAYVCNAFPGAGSAVISVANRTAGNLTEAIVLRITVIKSVSA
jgi:hypothetical protein